jgi:hypothetical protein
MNHQSMPANVGSNDGLGPNAQDDDRERTSYLTANELQAAQTLHKRAPYALCSVSRGFFSIARHYGGCTFQGCDYTYMGGHDECVRNDVLRLVTKMRKKQAKKPADVAAPVQMEFGA